MNARKEGAKRTEDLAFIEHLKTATEDELRMLDRNNSHKNAPPWKRVAIERAFKRLREKY